MFLNQYTVEDSPTDRFIGCPSPLGKSPKWGILWLAFSVTRRSQVPHDLPGGKTPPSQIHHDWGHAIIPWLWHARAIPYMPNFTRGMGIRLHISDHSRFGTAAESVSVKSYGCPSEENPAAAAIFGLRRKMDSGYEKLQMFPGSFMVKIIITDLKKKRKCQAPWYPGSGWNIPISVSSLLALFLNSCSLIILHPLQ